MLCLDLEQKGALCRAPLQVGLPQVRWGFRAAMATHRASRGWGWKVKLAPLRWMAWRCDQLLWHFSPYTGWRGSMTTWWKCVMG